MEAPDKIYIQPNAHDGWFEGNKPNDNFVEYIRKDALLEKLNRAIKFRGDGNPNGDTDGVQTIKAMINYIESL